MTLPGLQMAIAALFLCSVALFAVPAHAAADDVNVWGFHGKTVKAEYVEPATPSVGGAVVDGTFIFTLTFDTTNTNVNALPTNAGVAGNALGQGLFVDIGTNSSCQGIRLSPTTDAQPSWTATAVFASEKLFNEAFYESCGFVRAAISNDTSKYTLTGVVQYYYRSATRKQYFFKVTPTFTRDLNAQSSIPAIIMVVPVSTNDVVATATLPSKLKICDETSSELRITVGSEVCLEQTFSSPVINRLSIDNTVSPSFNPRVQIKDGSGAAVNALGNTASSMRMVTNPAFLDSIKTNGYIRFWVNVGQITCPSNATGSAVCTLVVSSTLRYTAGARRREVGDVTSDLVATTSIGLALTVGSGATGASGGSSSSSSDNSVAIGVGVGVGVGGALLVSAAVGYYFVSKKRNLKASATSA